MTPDVYETQEIQNLHPFAIKLQNFTRDMVEMIFRSSENINCIYITM